MNLLVNQEKKCAVLLEINSGGVQMTVPDGYETPTHSELGFALLSVIGNLLFADQELPDNERVNDE